MGQENSIIVPEWSHLVDVKAIGSKPLFVSIEASGDECNDVARRIGVESVTRLSAKLICKREYGQVMICISGTLKAQIKQKCVITLELVGGEIEDDFKAWYSDHQGTVSLNKVRQDRKKDAPDVEMEMLDEKDEPVPVVDGKIDVGELVVQHLSLAVELYPKADGASYKEGIDHVSLIAEPVRKNPFAALKEWKKNKD